MILLKTMGKTKFLSQIDISSLPAPDAPSAVFIASSIIEYVIEYMADCLEYITIDIISHLKYVRNVLDTAAKQCTHENCENDTLPFRSCIPNEIRMWLNSTFTRNGIPIKKKKSKSFKSVVNVIRTGLYIKRNYVRNKSLQFTTIHQEVRKYMPKVFPWNFDLFHFENLTNQMPLRFIAFEVLHRHGFLHRFDIPLDKFETMLSHLEQGYKSNENPYHNNLHACDVFLTMNYFVARMKLTKFMSEVEIFASLIAALVHDFNHTGTTNNFQINSRTVLSVLYNDKSVLENYHVSAFFRMMEKYNCDIFTRMEKTEFRQFRALLIELVLNTDMSLHVTHLREIETILHSNYKGSAIQNKRILCFLLHCSDISHPTKIWNIHYNWSMRCMKEFYLQGDKESELKLDVSPLCNRNQTNVPLSQMAFIEYVISPSFNLLEDLFSKMIGPYIYFLWSRDLQIDTHIHPIMNAKKYNTPWKAFLFINRIMWKTIFVAKYGLL